MFKMLILICPLHLAPADCQLETALDVIQGPQISSVFECGIASQVLVAQTAMRRAGEYM